jgi:hypothetical protein
MQPIQLHEEKFLRILWDEKTHIIAINWEALLTSAMTDAEFKTDLTLFAGLVEERRLPESLSM